MVPVPATADAVCAVVVFAACGGDAHTTTPRSREARTIAALYASEWRCALATLAIGPRETAPLFAMRPCRTLIEGGCWAGGNCTSRTLLRGTRTVAAEVVVPSIFLCAQKSLLVTFVAAYAIDLAPVQTY